MASLVKRPTFRPSIVVFALAAILIPRIVSSQELQTYKAGVVRIHNSKRDEAGTGFIIRIDKERVYIITAAHVVENDQHPSVYFFNRPNDSFQAELINREDDDQKGLAVLLVKVNKEVTLGLVSLKLGDPPSKGGELVKVIGFPDGTTLWSITTTHISRLEGRNLVFSGPIRAGHSGSPVLFNGQVIGLVTDTIQESAYAVRAENIPIYLNGIIPGLVSVSTSISTTTEDEPTKPQLGNGASNSDLCRSIIELLDASKNGFVSIQGAPMNAAQFYSNVELPGATLGYIIPPNRARYRVLTDKNKDNVERLFHTFIPKVRSCLPKWVEKEDSDSSYRFHKFRKAPGGVVVAVFYNSIPQRDVYYLLLDIALPSSNRSEW